MDNSLEVVKIDKEVMEFRKKKLLNMDKYLRKHIGDEEIFCNEWLTIYPDDASEDDTEFIALDEEAYNDCMRAFVNCVLLDE